VHPASLCDRDEIACYNQSMPLCLRALTSEEAATVQRWARSRTAPARLVERAQIVSLASQGEPIPEIARQLALDRRTVALRLQRFNAEGLAALADRPAPAGRQRTRPSRSAA